MTEPHAPKIVRILPTRIWVESCFFTGDRKVVMQHEGCEPFVYATFHYDYRYTDNNGTYRAALDLAVKLGAVQPVENRCTMPSGVANV